MAKNDVRSGKLDIKVIVESGELEGTAEIGGGVGDKLNEGESRDNLRHAPKII